LNPGRRGGKPATNRLSYGAAFLKSSFIFYVKLAWIIKLSAMAYYRVYIKISVAGSSPDEVDFLN
jgi:hypothetical protein